MDDRGQVSIELLLVIGVMIILAIAFLNQAKDVANGFSGKLNATSKNAMDLLDEPGFGK